MKKLLLFGLLISMSVMSYAGVLLTKSGARIENVTIVSVTDTEVIYSVNNGEPITISKNDLSAILYDDGRYEEIQVKENSNVVSSIGNNTESTGYNTPVWPNQMGESWKEDWKLFCKNSPNEVKEVTKAINLVVRKQGIFNFSGAADIDRQANDAYLNAKANGLSGEDAVRARNIVYINRANELSGSNFNTTQENPTYTSSNAANTFNLLAYGVFKGSKNYEVCHDYDGAVVEYRIIIKEGKQTIYTEYQQIGVVPFAFVSESFKQSYCATYTKFNIDLPEEVSYMQTIPFVVNGIDDTNKRNVTIQYRISKEGYKPVTVVWPETMLPQGEAICLPLNMLKPLSTKEKEKLSNTTSESTEDYYKKEKAMRDAGAVLTGCGIIPLGVPLLAIGQNGMKKIDKQGSEIYTNSAYVKEKKMRDAGAVLTGCGIIPLGVPLLAAGQAGMKKIDKQGSEIYTNSAYLKEKKMRDAGAVLTGCGIIPIGVPLLAAGQSDMKKIEKEEGAKAYNIDSNAIKIERLGKNRYAYDDIVMNAKTMAQFLKNNCPAAYSKYMSGKKLKGAGWGVFSAGLVMTAGGAAMMGVWEDHHPYGDYTLEGAGISLVCIGSISMAAVSIPLLGVGYHRTNHAHEIFNEQCATPEKLTLNLQASQNGLGLALNF
ncbi:MAG: hypothetical protein MJZ92_04830 [Paludibacteraceae bacterium]|nr:hypothetical protein [Paludibacteraceae bacterium]